MNNTSLLVLEQERLEKLKSYELDEESINLFRSRIQSVAKEESEKLGKQLFDMVVKKGYKDDYEKALNLVLQGANIEYVDKQKGNTSLMVCARKNLIKTFLVLVRAGANINFKNDYLTTPTMTSARNGNKEILRVLILMGADINARCLDGDTAIMSAKRHDQDECFQLLYRANAILNNRNLTNQSLIEIPSQKSVDLSTVKDRMVADAFASMVGPGEIHKLLQEAEQKLLQFKKNI